MKNARGAGRKPMLSDADLQAVLARREQGESIASIAEQYGISRQALSRKLLERKKPRSLCLDYLVEGVCVTRMEADLRSQTVRLTNYTRRLSEAPFSYRTSIDWDEWENWLEGQYQQGTLQGAEFVCRDACSYDFTMQEVLNCLGGEASAHQLRVAEGSAYDSENPGRDILRFIFRRRDLIYGRTDTDGYQLKALSHDRRWFVKSQARIGGTLMEDWAVEVIAWEICRQLKIPCVEQRPCEFVYEGQHLMGVCSPNFELDGYTFVSFERLLERRGLSSREEEFVHLGAVEKLEWCAAQLAAAGQLELEACRKYMLDLAVLDCLVGNVDRHTRNFGLFYQLETGEYQIPMIFDNGMGLFQHDPYRDEYATYEEAMRTVTIEPYGEDPFDLLGMLDERYDLGGRYPELTSLRYPMSGEGSRSGEKTPLDRAEALRNGFAAEYSERMVKLWQK